jgi:cytoskeleton protein RodZ
MAEIGQTLREARMRARVDITEVEARTKIRAKYLRAIENEEFGSLPGPVYVKSFLRTYGDFLGLDSRLLIDEYKRRYEHPSAHEVPTVAPLGRERGRERRGRGGPRGPVVPPWVVIGLVLIAIVAVLAVIGETSSSGPPGATSSPRKTSAPHRHAGARTKPRHATTVLVARKPRRVTLTLKPTGPVYVCMANGRGKLLIPGVTYALGQVIPTERAGKLLLTLGNANVTMTVNGKPVTVTPSSSAIGLEVTPSGTRPLAAALQPRCA